MNILLPLIIVEGLDVWLCSNIQDAEKAIEPWWVEQHEGAIYDAAGNCLSAEVVTEENKSLLPFGARSRQKVRIVAHVPMVNASEELRLVLIRHLVTSGDVRDEAVVHDESLNSLLDRVLNRHRLAR